jgi:flagellar basal-body rod modification protein FlgD
MNTIDSKVLDALNLAPRSAQKSDKMGASDFLKLMTTQLNNQDPTKPMQSGEFFSQIAQFSTVAGIQELQASFQQVATAMYSSQTLQASAMVGRSVLVPTNAATYAGSAVNGVVELPSSTTNLTVNISDQSGQLVRRLNLGQQPSGTVHFNWDGMSDQGAPMSPGVYSFNAQAQVGGEPVAVTTNLASKVESVTMGAGGQGITLNLTGIGSIPLSNVKQIM